MERFNIHTGDIVLVEYQGNDRELKTGLGLVVYHEVDDDHTFDKKNFTVMKLTSQMSECPYIIRLRTTTYSYLKQDSFVMVSKLQNVDNTAIKSHLGSINEADMIKVYKVYKRFQSEMERQILYKF